MISDLEEYYNHITYKSKEVAEYEDNEGTYFNVTPSNLIINVLYRELTKEEYEQAVFQQTIPKDIICNEIETTRIVPKSEITKNPKDQTILVDKKVKAKQVWIASNGLGLKKAYNDKEKALEFAKKINKKIFEVSGIEIK